MNIVILTGAELRHDFVRKSLALTQGVHVQRAYCEDMSLEPFVREQAKNNSQRLAHLAMRKQSEQDFFAVFSRSTQDQSNPIRLFKGEINQARCIDEIRALQPELIVAYGCSLIGDPLLAAFEGRILNVHLGLSPYYRGSSTNFWPLVNDTPEYCGATFMYMDSSIDTGEVIHQIRARICVGDSPHQIGNRLICDVALIYGEIVRKFEFLQRMEQLTAPAETHYYRRGDFSEQSVRILRENIVSGMVEKFMKSRRERCDAVPIIENSAVPSIGTLTETLQ